jgi:hypothetical protein
MRSLIVIFAGSFLAISPALAQSLPSVQSLPETSQQQTQNTYDPTDENKQFICVSGGNWSFPLFAMTSEEAPPLICYLPGLVVGAAIGIGVGVAASQSGSGPHPLSP